MCKRADICTVKLFNFHTKPIVSYLKFINYEIHLFHKEEIWDIDSDT